MLVYIDNNSWSLWSAPTRSPVLRFAFDRGSTEPVALKFVTDGVVAPLGTGATGTLGFKAHPTDTSYLIPTVSWVKSGSGASTVYTFLPTFLSTDLDTLLGSSESAQVYGQIKWTDGTTVGQTPVFRATIANNVTRGGETIPTVGPWTTLTSADNNSTLANGGQYLADTTAAIFTVKLPLAPEVGDEVVVADKEGTWPTHNLTIARNAQLIDGNAGNLVCDTTARISLVFVGGAKGWEVYVG